MRPFKRMIEKALILHNDRKNQSAEALISDLSIFKGIHKGRRCFIMGNGPSLNKMNLELLKDDIVFGLNSCFLLFGRISWRPKYWVCVDTRVIPDRARDFLKMHARCPEMVMFMPNQLVEHQPGGKVTITSKFIPPGPNRYYFRHAPPAAPLPRGAFSEDIHKYVIIPYTVAVTALQIAYYMGFDPVYLIGCDTNYTVKETVKQDGPTIQAGRPFEEADAKEKVNFFLTSTRDDDPNHFDPTYFGKNRKWHAPNQEKMIWHYEQVAAFAKARNWRVRNATVGGKLEAFERVEFETLFGNGRNARVQ